MAGTTDSTTATSAPDAAVGDAPEKTRKAGERKDGEGRYSRSRSRERTSYRDRDRSRDRDRRDRRDSDRDRRSSRSDRDRRDRRSDTRDRRYEDERRSSRYERRSSRSRSPRRKRTKDKTPAFDKGAVAAALARANGAITGSFASTVPGADPSLGYGLGTAVSGMETRRAGESVQQFFQRRMAGMRMLKARYTEIHRDTPR
ncbi:hypothetical protein EMIHUDRAFT_225756 [Emiliania huxleyi CCMP1516]|uniref:Uncharacterized protein n=2 Tax=Emiliania huxleyi TaxID=2903 RepID=A0A0D3KNG0_EMIH1|nr:hypothetical protein EMIHUDRAFT_225756 [Emiliania huxleyi CCMP1516]EOD37295.1 hypothetical protein EMIHUDRAFT_225756 [Emiliania huxleyi CCMP1516]|eukprot:XP_005789724.1 hypothetical protein EMIHUDRAFT_225756 [Emiliania huxleyi CCMP1516]